VTITADEARSLTAEEKATLDRLLARASADKSPAARIGEPYEALICLSVPRRGDKDRATDLVHPGETVYLTEEEARAFNRHGTRDGRQVEVVRKLSGPDGSHDSLPPVLPRHVSGRLFRPTVPPPGSDAPRPDPEGSSRIQYLDDGRAPEGAEPARPDASELADHLRETVQADALDLPPRNRARTRSGRPA
jgi:hypothetical protein